MVLVLVLVILLVEVLVLVFEPVMVLVVVMVKAFRVLRRLLPLMKNLMIPQLVKVLGLELA